MQHQNQDIRWLQRFRNFNKALSQLKKFIDKNELNDLEKQGLIKAFEYTYELAWNVLKDYFEYQGNKNINGSRDAINEAFRKDLIINGEAWMQMFKDRNQTSHSYNETTANEISENIFNIYFQLFIQLQAKMESLLNANETQLF
ncbi:MAG: nucleotidyltransferase substrate binding protein [Bacteroidota bacterium]|nr:nucleotidyltransferase substrate binding protein [Bacteroidota bacterium]